MATPIILINSATGSDTQASGAGPATAIFGAAGRTRSAAGQLHFGFFGATDDFSGVATDGSHVCFMGITTSGIRNFAQIAGIKNARETGTDGAITSGTAILAVGSTSGWTAGDVIRVNGAGAAGANLFTTVNSVDSATQATLAQNASTTVSGATWENPKQATLTTGQGTNTGTSDAAWAIGGKRASIGGTTSLKLIEQGGSAAGDAMPGWIMQLESSHTETIAATKTFRRAGDTTTGKITLRGEPGAGTLPIITFSNNGVAFAGTTNIHHIRLADFEIRNSNATKTASVAIGTPTGAGWEIKGLKVNHATDKFWKALTNSTSTSQIIVRDSEFGNLANIGFDITNIGNIQFCNVWIHDCGSHGISLAQSTAGTALVMLCLLNDNAGDGINVNINATGNCIVIWGNTIDDNGSDGIEFVDTAASDFLRTVQVVNNILTNNTVYGLNFSGAGWTAALLADSVMVANNNCDGNGTGETNPASVGTDDPSLDPTFTDTSTGDYRIGTNLKAQGYPEGVVGGYGPTRSYTDIGAYQREEPAGGGGGGATTLVNGVLVRS